LTRKFNGIDSWVDERQIVSENGSERKQMAIVSKSKPPSLGLTCASVQKMYLVRHSAIMLKIFVACPVLPLHQLSTSESGEKQKTDSGSIAAITTPLMTGC
jgi:hypothetical protein